MPVGGIFGGLFAWPVADSLGRQAALIIGGVPGLIGWLLISLSILFSSSLGFFFDGVCREGFDWVCLWLVHLLCFGEGLLWQ